MVLCLFVGSRNATHRESFDTVYPSKVSDIVLIRLTVWTNILNKFVRNPILHKLWMHSFVKRNQWKTQFLRCFLVAKQRTAHIDTAYITKYGVARNLPISAQYVPASLFEPFYIGSTRKL